MAQPGLRLQWQGKEKTEGSGDQKASVMSEGKDQGLRREQHICIRF